MAATIKMVSSIRNSKTAQDTKENFLIQKEMEKVFITTSTGINIWAIGWMINSTVKGFISSKREIDMKEILLMV